MSLHKRFGVCYLLAEITKLVHQLKIITIAFVLLFVAGIFIISKWIHTQIKTPEYKPLLTILFSMAMAIVLLVGGVIGFVEKTFTFLKRGWENKR